MTDETTPAPKPTPVPKPSALKPAAPRPTPAGGSVPAASPAKDRNEELAAAKKHGRVDESLTVFVVLDSGEREVGQYPNATADEALEYFARKYLELVDAAALLGDRLTAGANGESVRQNAQKQREALPEAKAVGDFAALEQSLSELEQRASKVRAEQTAQQNEAREAGLQARTTLVEEAESIAAADPARVQWKTSGARMRELFDEWKDLQSSTPKLPRNQDQELWGRFSKARNTFDKHRREFFADLDKRNSEGKSLKEKIVAEAEALSQSTEWREVSQKYRDLMAKWKAAPRAGRKDDDSLWARFRAAQDVFFAARAKKDEEVDAEYAQNLVVKEELLKEAQALLPITNPGAAKSALRTIQDRWEDAGKVPRADVSRMENGLRDVERALADAENDQWRRTNPETKARTSGMLAQLEESLAKLEADVNAAQESGDDKAVKKAQEALDTKRAWYEQLSKTAADLS